MWAIKIQMLPTTDKTKRNETKRNETTHSHNHTHENKSRSKKREEKKHTPILNGKHCIGRVVNECQQLKNTLINCCRVNTERSGGKESIN